MFRSTWRPALALGAVLATCGAASAADRDTLLLGGGSGDGTTMTLGGKGTAAQAATEDTELTGGYRGYYGWGGGFRYGGYYGGYRGFYGGFRPYYSSFRAPFYGGFRPYSSFYSFNFYRPAFYTPRVFYSNFYTPVYAPFPVYTTFYSPPSFYLGIGGAAGSGAPTVPLGADFARPQPAQPMAQPGVPGGDGTFPYDGGPINPVPVPKGEPQMIPPAAPSATVTDLPISVKPKSTTSPYRYKAYGEK